MFKPVEAWFTATTESARNLAKGATHLGAPSVAPAPVVARAKPAHPEPRQERAQSEDMYDDPVGAKQKGPARFNEDPVESRVEPEDSDEEDSETLEIIWHGWKEREERLNDKISRRELEREEVAREQIGRAHV